ncbi:MAG: hypothetical protein CXX81_07290 [Methanobacteriota archaeon]|nr:MAG: hypothetical protein CXX81_07290 [Euryarchaeota archaeon]HIA25636.1 hypothetical protein [Candidatus Poseidoniales archaeon]
MVSRKNWEDMCDLIKNKGSDQNSLQILEQDRRETVLVNALAYFLHPQRGGLVLNDNQMLKNLISSINGKKYLVHDRKKNTGNLLCMTTEFPCYMDLNIEETPKRIDLFLEFEYYCIGIEAKVDADLKNDLGTYRTNVENRAASRNCDSKTMLLLTKKKKEKLLNDLTNKSQDDEGRKEIEKNWQIITWEEITKDCDFNSVSEKKVENVEDLLEALKNIDMVQDENVDGLVEETETLDEYANKLKDRLDEWKDEDVNCFIWSGERKIRHIVEPRVVIEYPKDKFKIDVCVGFRGVQFIIFNNRKYKPKLYEKICKKYSFFYWRDYSDPIEHFDRYLLSEPGTNGKPGPLFPKENMSAEEENTVYFEYNKSENSWIKETITKIEEIIKLKDV